jgi:hypothetical protein
VRRLQLALELGRGPVGIWVPGCRPSVEESVVLSRQLADYRPRSRSAIVWAAGSMKLYPVASVEVGVIVGWAR